MARKTYPDDVWEAIKLIWESMPKISWAEVLRQVAQSMQCEVPSISTVSERRNAEKWVKIPNKIPKSDPKNSVKIRKESKVKNETNSTGCADFLSEKISRKMGDDTEKKALTVPELKIIVEEARTEQSRVIERHRQSSDLVSTLRDSLLTQADEVFSLPLKMDDKDFEENAVKHLKLITLLEKKSSIATALTIINKNAQETQFKAWGIKEITDEDAEKARKQDYQKLDEDLAKERDEVKVQQQQLFVERTRLIESGAFEERNLVSDKD
ncbi:MAG: hypothetical protein AB7F64_09190 [Gammaproteobacteria bacterium]